MLRIGTAGWSIAGRFKARFPADGSGLARYAAGFDATEIDSSFYRPHRPATYERWAAAVPVDFRFAIKVPRTITHVQRLHECAGHLRRFLADAGHLGPQLGPLVVQLPPSLNFEAATAWRFFSELREMFDGPVACEPRHPTWFGVEAADVLMASAVARVVADPALAPDDAPPAATAALAYYRLHGAPEMYFSKYDAATLASFAARLSRETADEVWCILDNTARGEALDDAEVLRTLLACGTNAIPE